MIWNGNVRVFMDIISNVVQRDDKVGILNIYLGISLKLMEI